MPKPRIKRFYYRNGSIHAEVKEVAGQLHGLNRTWHFNGKLAEELRYCHGRLHGASRHWDEHGHLLGSFTMNHGTGTQRYWHQNGVLRMEINSMGGKIFGRTRIWLRDGTLVDETYYISNVKVPRRVYLNAARTHPDWPQHQKQSQGKVARKGPALRLKEYQLFIQSLLDKSHVEARQWLRAVGTPNLRSLAKFRSLKAALHFVESLYALGAIAVIALPIYPGRGGKLFADWLLIKLPKEFSRRKALRKAATCLCKKRSAALLPEDDIGENHLFIRLA